MLELSSRREAELGPEGHELSRLFAEQGFALNATLVEMLSEHFSHRTERRGCGFTQATRHLAVLVNQPRTSSQATIAKLFPDQEQAAQPLQRTLRSLPPLLEREESRILLALIADLVLPAATTPGVEELPAYFELLKVGTCPLAEKYFLEISDGFVRGKGRVNVLVSEAGAPLLLEKLNLGDNHSCINVAELLLNGVRLPPGCLFGVRYEEGVEARPNRKLPGSVIPIRARKYLQTRGWEWPEVDPRSRVRRMYFEMIGQMKKTLGQLDHWLEAAAAHATAKSFDPSVFLSLRLAPDQFAFARQVQITCDTAKLAAARLAGKEAPKHADTEQTLDELRARAKSVIEYLNTFTAADFAGADTQKVKQPRWETKFMLGADYFREHALPNFYFHSAHVYAILRHNGVNLGKKDFLGALSMRTP